MILSGSVRIKSTPEEVVKKVIKLSAIFCRSAYWVRKLKSGRFDKNLKYKIFT